MARAETIRRAVLCVTLSCLVASGGAPLAADAPRVACSADTPTVEPGAAVGLHAWASDPSGRSLRYAWDAPIGRLDAEGRRARWELQGVRPGVYAATVRVSVGAAPSTECVMRVVVRTDAGPRGGITRPTRETGAALLAPGTREADGYGLYSYLLLGAPPTSAARDRYVKAIEAFWSVLPAITALEQYVPKRELNIAYVPITTAPGASISAEWLLDNYDYARARSLLRLLPGPNRDGPYLYSALQPLGTGSAAATPSLFQNLSNVPPHLAGAWVKEFLNQAAQERFWDERSGATLALKLRVTVSVLGEGLPEVKKALDGWIAWTR